MYIFGGKSVCVLEGGGGVPNITRVKLRFSTLFITPNRELRVGLRSMWLVKGENCNGGGPVSPGVTAEEK
jgi:hypothetical protein